MTSLKRLPSWVGVAAFVAAASFPVSAARPQSATPDVVVFAAASLQTVLDGLAAPIERATGAHLKASYAASSALARQIEAGAPADMFISADLDWMDYVAERRLIRPETRVNLLGNTLVLIAPAGRPRALTIAPGFGIAAALGPDRLAVADPASVPAGKYARAALTSLGVWPGVENKLAPAENVRAALLLVSRDETPLGIVYRTDALAEPGVVIIDTFPENTHPPIVYPIALTTTASPAAARVLAWLRGPEAKAAFDQAGFAQLK